MPLTIKHGDITKMKVDAIVNAANTKLQQGSGVCGAIFKAAGADKLQEECNKFKGCPIGYAVITKGYDLPASYIIHTVGPVWQGGQMGEPFLLESCYRKSLELADRYGMTSIAFPLISAGIFGYPKNEAKKIAEDTIHTFLKDHNMDVYLMIYDEKKPLSYDRSSFNSSTVK